MCSKNFVSFGFAEFFYEISPKRNETWPWRNEISAKCRSVTKQKKYISGKPYSLHCFSTIAFFSESYFFKLNY